MGITTSGNARGLRLVAGMAAVAVTASACASGGGSSQPPGEAADAGGVINMVMAPDPVWKWLEDQGIKQEMEEAAGIQVLTSSSWDEFGVYAGGHADVISAATYEVPDLAEATGEPATVFGAYNTDRSILAVGADNPAQNICDLEGQKIATFTSVSITLIWGMYAKEMCGLDLSADGGDYELVVTDIQNLASLVARGDAAACLCLPDFAIPELSTNQIKPLYDAKSAAQMWAENYSSFPEDVTHPQTNVFVAREAWVEKNQEEASFLIELWDRGIQEWQEHRDEIIAAYPEDFAVRTPEEMAFLQDWLDNRFDWFVPTTYLTEEWVEGEREVFDLMKETGFVEEDVEEPSFTTLEKPAS
ncbi:ABC transporter substrate-binding protein [Geodermatophilus sp. YIM 151500]|uniref:ABC transporter substrate-binding protein n=1 Tax=Geodermatophilus sp. YIM 151500 TaxID=2984531 RepID=UPI0021E3BD8F|nr:ABC transporter substrate-binding protein [Geodermatophilus sp. YIM 151500]MCV2488896.1 ABC transporter substrate-binding protein [Geodermatophilus sp. YIM 151500]